MTSSAQNSEIRNPLRDQELLNEIANQLNLDCNMDYIFNRVLFYTNKTYTMEDLSQFLHGLDEESITYIKSFFLKVIIKNHPLYKDLVLLYPTSILRHIVPEDDFKFIECPQDVLFSPEFLAHKKRYNLHSRYSLVAKDAGIGYLPSHVIPKITEGSIIDGGCFDAETTLVFTDYTPHKVYAFEPIRKHIAMMKKKIASFNKQDEIEIVECGLADKDSSFSMDNELIDGSATFKGLDESSSSISGSYLAHVTSLDKFVTDNHVDKVSLIKLDIEGFEQQAIQGMNDLLKRDKPILLISIYHSFDDFIRIKIIIDKMNLGYKLAIRHLDPAFYYEDFTNLTEEYLHSGEYMLFAYVD